MVQPPAQERRLLRQRLELVEDVLQMVVDGAMAGEVGGLVYYRVVIVHEYYAVVGEGFAEPPGLPVYPDVGLRGEG